MTDRDLGGRPRLDPSARRNQRVRMNLTEQELVSLLAICREGESPGSAARRKLFYEDDDPEAVNGDEG